MIEPKTQENPIPLKLFLPSLLAGTVIALLNLQWMQLFQLINAPQADSLVYMTESFNDYWSMRNGDFAGLFKKYVLDGNQQTSPVLWWLAALSYFMLGTDPVNAYLVIAVLYLAWVAGMVYLAWCVFQDSKYAMTCGLIAAFLPSVAANGLRNFMLDFVAAAPFIWATAYLLKSNLGYKRWEVVIYSVLCGITVLLRTTSIPYFASHIVIVFLLALSQKRHPHYGNILLAVLVGGLSCGWFIFPNLERIFSYYGYWASQARLAGTENSFFSNLGFYLHLIRKFHLHKTAFALGLAISALAGFRLAYRHIKGTLGPQQRRILVNALIILLPLAGVSTILLSFYSSRAATVDYPYIATYLMLPPLLWRLASKKTQTYWIGAGIMIVALAATQAKFLIVAPSQEIANIDYREREVLQMILEDAEKDGVKDIKIGNTPIHQHNSLSYKYWILANYYPRWRGHVDGMPIGRTNSAEELAKMNANADYVITAVNYHADWHPNNVVAPAANRILQEFYGMDYMPRSFNVPGGVTIRILKNQKPRVTFPSEETDGWHQDQVPITLLNPKQTRMLLRITGNLFQGKPDSRMATVTLVSKSDPTRQLDQKIDTPAINITFQVPPSFFDKNGTAELILQSSWAGQPSSISNSPDSRNLAFRNLKLFVEQEPIMQ